MRITTTDGKEYDFIDECAHCELDTAGNHKFDCPLYYQQDIYVPMPPVKEYTINVKINKIEKAKPKIVILEYLKEGKMRNNEPTKKDLASPKFNAVWNAIKKWDIERNFNEGYASATGTDVMIILNALRELKKKK